MRFHFQINITSHSVSVRILERCKHPSDSAYDFYTERRVYYFIYPTIGRIKQYIKNRLWMKAAKRLKNEN